MAILTMAIRLERCRGLRGRITRAAGAVRRAGALLVLLLPRIPPFATDTHVASPVMGQDRWNAGVTMMRTADPEVWRGVVDASQLVCATAEAIGQCAVAARTAGADQQFTITVKAPAR